MLHREGIEFLGDRALMKEACNRGHALRVYNLASPPVCFMGCKNVISQLAILNAYCLVFFIIMDFPSGTIGQSVQIINGKIHSYMKANREDPLSIEFSTVRLNKKELVGTSYLRLQW